MANLNKIKTRGTVIGLTLTVLGAVVETGAKIYVAVKQGQMNGEHLDPAKIAKAVAEE